MMPTNEERKEVARRLRDNADQNPEWVIPWAAFNDAEEHEGIELHNRLADLIEPAPERTCKLNPTYGVGYQCSECGRLIPYRFKTGKYSHYCPNCGAKVEGAAK